MDDIDLVVRAHELAISDAQYTLNDYKEMLKEQKCQGDGRMSDFEKSMIEMAKRANDFVHEKRAEGITVIPAREFFEAIGIIDFFFGNDVGIDISNFKGDEE